MKYRHAFHAGNFADVHKHLTLVALLRALRRKERGFLFVDTHGGRGRYALQSGDASSTGEAAGGIEALSGAIPRDPAIADYLEQIGRWRSEHGPQNYPGSPLIAARLLRPQDRGYAYEAQPAQFAALRSALRHDAALGERNAQPSRGSFRVEHGDGYERLRSHLPPAERRGLILIDPPYEDARNDFRLAGETIHDTLHRFETAVVLCWYPIKDARESDRRVMELVRTIERPALAGEIWKHPPDSRAALNGSGLLIINAPFRLAEQLRDAQLELATLLGIRETGRAHLRVLRAEGRTG